MRENDASYRRRSEGAWSKLIAGQTTGYTYNSASNIYFKNLFTSTPSYYFTFVRFRGACVAASPHNINENNGKRLELNSPCPVGCGHQANRPPREPVTT
jgi:hypothetical protein